MTNELTVIEKMQEVIRLHLNEYLPQQLEPITDGQVDISFPDVDKMPNATMLYVTPDYAEYEDLTTCSDDAQLRISVFLLCKRDTRANLTLKTYGYYNALYELLRKDTSLDGAVTDTTIESTDFYPAVEGNPNVQGVEVSVIARFAKDF